MPTYTKIFNNSGGAVPLPPPYCGWLRGGQSVIVPDALAVVQQLMSGSDFLAGLFQLSETDSLNATPWDRAHWGAGLKLIVVGPVAAKSATAIHAALAGTAAKLFPGPITQPATPRGLNGTFGAGYDGGNVTIFGTNWKDENINETLVANPGGAVSGVKIFKSVTKIEKAAIGANGATVSIGTIDKLGIGDRISDTAGLLFVVATPEDVTLDAAEDAFTPTTVPNGTTYKLLVTTRPEL